MHKAVNYIKEIIKDFEPQTAVILGSGLGELADKYSDIRINYKDIPEFPVSTVEGHAGCLVFAEINGKRIMMMQGRFHFYEGYPMHKIVYPVKIMKKLGISTVIITNAAGGINPDFKPSSLMIIRDHINFMGTNPLIGVNDDTLGERFPDMSEVYTKQLRDIALTCGEKLNIPLKEGVYMAMSGPAYETPAEVNMARIIGADALGMSTVPEAITAAYLKMRVLGISCICNAAAGVGGKSLSHEDVLGAANKAKKDFSQLILEIIKAV